MVGFCVAVMNFWIPYNAGNVIICGHFSFWRRTGLYSM